MDTFRITFSVQVAISPFVAIAISSPGQQAVNRSANAVIVSSSLLPGFQTGLFALFSFGDLVNLFTRCRRPFYRERAGNTVQPDSEARQRCSLPVISASLQAACFDRRLAPPGEFTDGIQNELTQPDILNNTTNDHSLKDSSGSLRVSHLTSACRMRLTQHAVRPLRTSFRRCVNG